MASDDIETRLCAARTRLILDQPFLGALALRLPLVAADPKWCPTTATDARSLYYNPEHISALSAAETRFVLAHEALHCALSHFARRQHRVRARWDLACDYAINPLLVAEGLQPPPGALVEASFEGMTAEEIYPCIDETSEEEPMDRHVYEDTEEGSGRDRQVSPDRDGQEPSRDWGSGSGDAPRPEARAEPESRGAPQPPPLTAEERDTLAVQWRQRLAGAAQQAMQAGRLGGAMARLVDHLLQPQLPWRMLLARYMTALARDDYTYMRPSRREGTAILPSLRSAQVEVVVALDTSGSIRRAELEAFLSEVTGIKGQMRARLTLLACDSALAPGAPWTFEPWEPLALPDDLQGGGGTRFVPVFDWIESQDLRPDLVVYFTDARGDFPESEPAYPVLWLVKGREVVPWGQRLQLN